MFSRDLIHNSTGRSIRCSYEVLDPNDQPKTEHATIPPGTHRLPPGGLEVLLENSVNDELFESGALRVSCAAEG